MTLRLVTGEDLHGEEYARNPFPIWRRMRDDQPLLYDEVGDRWMLSRYDDVVAVLSDPQMYSARTYQERFRPVFGRTLAELDGPRHIRERTIVAPVFVGRSLQGYRPFIEGAVDRISAGVTSSGTLDLVEAMTRRLPLTTIATMLGFPPSDTEMLLEIGATILDGLADEPAQRAAGAEAHRRLAAHLQPMMEDRRVDPGDDLISRIVGAEADGECLTDDEIHSFVSFLLVAGGPTTDMALRNFWWALLAQPEELDACRGEPERVGRALSESLRRDGPIVYEDRRTNAPVEWYGTLLPADSDVLVCLGAANTDDSVFAHADVFDPDRSDLLMGTERKPGFREAGVAGHLAFGLGSHFCMGYQLARAEAVAATERFLLRLPAPRLIDPAELRVTWYERTLEALPVCLNA